MLPKPIRYDAVLIVAVVIFYGSLITVPETVVDDTQPGLINLNHWRHLVAYFTLACSLAYATDHWNHPIWRHAPSVIALATLYGIAMEAGQAVLPHRSAFLLTDIFVNTVGASGVVGWSSSTRGSSNGSCSTAHEKTRNSLVPGIEQMS